MTTASPRLRSTEWFDTPELYGWLRKAAFMAQGYGPEAYDNRPIIGICNSWSELTHCNAHLRQLAEAVKRGVWQAGGFPMEFPVMSLGEYNMRPTTMLFRNLMSMEVEESLRANPLDGVVLLGGCDKTTPALLMGAASADIPAIIVTGGPQLKGQLARRRTRLLHRLPPLRSRTPRRKHHPRRLGRSPDLHSPQPRPLHGNGHRLHHGIHGRSHGHRPPGQRRHPRR